MAASRSGSDARRYEAASLDAALARVHADLGGDARVLEANRVRRGGVGGFFAREWVEVIAAPPGPAGASPPVARVEPAAEPVAAPTSTPLDPVLDLAERMNAIERTVQLPVPTEIDLVDDDSSALVSTERAGFEAVLARVAASVGTASPAPTEELLEPAPESTPVAPATAPATPSPVTPTRPPRLHTTRRVPARVTRAQRRERAEELARSGTSVTASLVAMGVPERLVPHDVDPLHLRHALAESLVSLPGVPSLPATRGVVVAVVGNGSAPIALAEQILEEHDLPEDALVVASADDLIGLPAWLRIDDGAAAAERRQSWRRRDRATVVAVPCVGADGAAFAREVLDNLEPTVVWGVVEAYRKPEDVTAWCERLGGVDALALVGLRDTASPAAVLRTGIAVGRVDGEVATPLHWADLLTERLT